MRRLERRFPVRPGHTRAAIRKSLLRLFVRLLKGEEMLRYKSSKTEYDKGKRAELEEKVRKLAVSRTDYVERQKTRDQRREQKCVVETVQRYIERFAHVIQLAMRGKE